MSQLQIVKGMEDIKMNGSVHLKKYFDKIFEKLPFIALEAIFLLAVTAFFGVFTLISTWFMLGVQPLRLDQIIFIVSVLSATIIAFRVPVWFPKRSSFVVITCEIIVFSLSEVAVFVPTTMNLFWLWNYMKESGKCLRLPEIIIGNQSVITVSIMSLMSYVWILLPLMNTVLHSAFIQHLMFKSKYTSGIYRAAVKAGCCILGLMMLYGSMLGLLDLSQSNFHIITMLLASQVIVFSMVMLYVHVQVCVAIGKAGKEVKFMKLIGMYTHPYLSIVFIAMIPMLISFVIMLTKYGATPLVGEVKNVVGKFGHMKQLKKHQQTTDFEELSFFWSLISSVNLAVFWSLCRDVYLHVKTGVIQLKPFCLITESKLLLSKLNTFRLSSQREF